jgi:hypothetical protein
MLIDIIYANFQPGQWLEGYLKAIAKSSFPVPLLSRGLKRKSLGNEDKRNGQPRSRNVQV